MVLTAFFTSSSLFFSIPFICLCASAYVSEYATSHAVLSPLPSLSSSFLSTPNGSLERPNLMGRSLSVLCASIRGHVFPHVVTIE
ncbi:hypothetical protein C8R42DRAFT_475813 [Lentinula raphanica]|nr:hypothetical protein C8R42DRAFT_475813 [Lentinula raphanica]